MYNKDLMNKRLKTISLDPLALHLTCISNAGQKAYEGAKEKKSVGNKETRGKNSKKINTQDKNPVCFIFYKVYEH